MLPAALTLSAQRLLESDSHCKVFPTAELHPKVKSPMQHLVSGHLSPALHNVLSIPWCHPSLFPKMLLHLTQMLWCTQVAPLLKDTVTKNCSHSIIGKATSGLAGWVFYWCTVQITFVSSFSQGSKCELVLNYQLLSAAYRLEEKEYHICCTTWDFRVWNHSLVVFVFSNIVQLWPGGEPEFRRSGVLFHLIILYDTVKWYVLSSCV